MVIKFNLVHVIDRLTRASSDLMVIVGGDTVLRRNRVGQIDRNGPAPVPYIHRLQTGNNCRHRHAVSGILSGYRCDVTQYIL